MIKKFLYGCSGFALSGLLSVFAQNPASVIDLSQLLQIEQLANKVSDRQVVFVGEIHDRYDHHLNQLEIIRLLHQRHDRLAIGLEFFQQPFQAVLDDYIDGNIDEKTMLKQTEYYDRWRFDYRLYQPILQYAREHRIPLLALNIEREITDIVKSSSIEGLSDEQKQRIPEDIDFSDEDYRARLEQIFQQHPHATEQVFERFHQVQLLWDESMAETAANWLSQNPEGHMVVLAGAGHIIYGSGIPNRLVRRLPVKTATVINTDAGLGLDPAQADFVIVSPRQDLPASGKMGVVMDLTDSPPRITGFSDSSGARQAGIKHKDRIIDIDGQAIETFADIRLALTAKEVGEMVNVTVQRNRFFGGTKQLSFDVRLE